MSPPPTQPAVEGLRPAPPRRRAFPASAFLGWANLTTSGVAAAGFLGVLLVPAHPRVAVTLLCVATALDRLDGLVARRLGQVSAFGAQLDSLADALAFCALPAALATAVGGRGPLADAAAVAFVLCGLWRLAHFNLHGLGEGAQGGLYTGVPTTIAASWWLVLAPLLTHLPPASRAPAADVVTVVAALAMVSKLPYPKDGPATRVLYALVPAATAAVWLWRA